MRLLNFGCGGTFHPDWTNIDTAPVSPEVLRHDLRRPFPFAAGSFDAVYGSHVLEHLEPAAAHELLQDCRRVLRPGGLIRLAVPDLEEIARLYLAALEGALEGDREAALRCDWFTLELYDQVVRRRSGGQMAGFLAERSADGSLRLIADRIAVEGAAPSAGRRRLPTGARLLRKLRSAADSARRKSAVACASLLLGARGAKALREGLFRNAGEVHQWMYDRFSMARALERAGFRSIRQCAAGESGIEGFAGYGLELIEGRERKPDSLYMEGRKGADS